MNAIATTTVAVSRAALMIALDPEPSGLPRSFVVPADLGLGDAPSPVPAPRIRTLVPESLRSPKLPGGAYVSTSALEAAGLLGLLCDPTLTRVVPRAHTLGYRVGDAWLRFVPDAVALCRDRGVVAYAFRFTWDRAEPAWQATERSLRRAYREQGVKFVVLTETLTFAKSARENRRAMLRHRVEDERTRDVEKVRDALALLGLPTTVEKLRRRARLPVSGGAGRALRCLFGPALAGEIGLDLDRPFGGDTGIRRGPLA
ncbi:hypothetical protein [Methylobacterium thuringiense]|uniref:Uncharacterized protein n=1 Tax=Methylobacterium thuringiense TaxID=1003091 RepID=A0ABQ4TJ87_9HYPH|nr:hypothetical protein [Methylobacterium thuringiense]GJE54879.1 hypothetical protein EKPJFOCH_1364 [Methylobacterium thuringiense]